MNIRNPFKHQEKVKYYYVLAFIYAKDVRIHSLIKKDITKITLKVNNNEQKMITKIKYKSNVAVRFKRKLFRREATSIL